MPQMFIKMQTYDVLIIGAGLLGCFAARNLSKYKLRIALLDKSSDVCTGVSKANNAVVYTGSDTWPGTLKTRLCVSANRHFDQLCADLGVDFNRCGSFMVAYGHAGEKILQDKLANGLQNEVRGLELLSGDKARQMNPAFSEKITAALYCSETGTANPWSLGIAAAENAVQNGTGLFLDHEVTYVEKCLDGYWVFTNKTWFKARVVINTAGIAANAIRNVVCPPKYRINLSKAEFLILDPEASFLTRNIVFQETESKGKGITLVPTVEGNILIGASKLSPAAENDSATTREGLEYLCRQTRRVFPDFKKEHIIHTFAGLCQDPHLMGTHHAAQSPTVSGAHFRSFTIDEDAHNPGFFSLIGIGTPGMTCADELGSFLTEKCVSILGQVEKNPNFNPIRKRPIVFAKLPLEQKAIILGENKLFGRIVCECNLVTEAEIIQAIQQTVGAVTVEGVKRRTNAGMGICQGGSCIQRIMEIIARERNIPLDNVRIKEAVLINSLQDQAELS